MEILTAGGDTIRYNPDLSSDMWISGSTACKTGGRTPIESQEYCTFLDTLRINIKNIALALLLTTAGPAVESAGY